jgi:hypothetical protein
MILRGLDEQVVMTSPIKGLFWNMFRTERTSSATFKRCVLSGRSSLCWYYLAFWSTRFDIMSSGVAVLTSLLISLNFTGFYHFFYHSFFKINFLIADHNWCPEPRAGCLSGYSFQYREREGPPPHCYGLQVP